MRDYLRDNLPLTDPVLVFALVMVIILIAPWAAARLRLPGIIGIIVAGAIVGASGLNLIERPGAIELLGTVGLLYLMFVAGMSMDLHQFAATKGRSVSFGMMSFFIPQIMGIAVGMMYLGYGVPQALLLGSILGTHTLLAYPIARRLGIVRNRAVTMTTGGTIFCDALALSLLAVAAAMVVGELTTLFWVRFALLVGGFVFAVVFLVPALGRWFFRNASGRGEVEFVFLMVVLFAAAATAKYVGLAPIVGAFLAGLTMNRLVPDTGPLMNRLHFVGDALFIPFFLLSVGMLIDFRVLGSLEVWTTAAAFTSLLLVGKGVAAKLSQYVFGYTSDEGWTVFGLTIPQAAATLAITIIGYQLTQTTDYVIFTEREVNAVVIMILITCIAGPWLVETFGRRVALAEEVQPYQPGQAPLRILIPLANPSSAPALMDIAFMIRRPDSPEPVYPLMVAREAEDTQAQVAAGEKMLGHVVIYAAGAGVPVVPVTRIDMSIASGISRAVKEMRISTVVIGWTGAPSKRFFHLGTVLDQLLHENPQTIMVCRFIAPINTTKRIVLIVPRLLEREPSFGEAIRTIRLLTSKLGAKLVVVAHEQELDRLEQRLPRIRPTVPTSFESITSYEELLPKLGSIAQADDMLIALSTREGRLAWTHDLARTPRRLVDRIPNHNLVVFYPSEQTAETAWFTGPALSVAAGLQLDPSRTVLGLEPQPFDDAVQQMIAAHFKTRIAAAREVRDALVRNAKEYSTEVAPGTVLLHAHVRHVAVPTFFLATCETGLEVPRLGKPAHVLLVLLSPESLPADDHLRALADVAKAMQKPMIAERLRSVRTFEELQAALE